MTNIKPTKRGLFGFIAAALSFPFAAKAAPAVPDVPYEDRRWDRARPQRGTVLVTWTSRSGRQFTFNVDRQADEHLDKTMVHGRERQGRRRT